MPPCGFHSGFRDRGREKRIARHVAALAIIPSYSHTFGPRGAFVIFSRARRMLKQRAVFGHSHRLDIRPAQIKPDCVVHRFIQHSLLPDGPPPSIDFTSHHNFHKLVPQLGQAFYIGDGRTQSGVVQRFDIHARTPRNLGDYARECGLGQLEPLEFFLEDKQTGALELILSTPTSERAIARGLWLAYGRKMFFPMLIALLVSCFFVWQIVTMAGLLAG